MGLSRANSTISSILLVSLGLVLFRSAPVQSQSISDPFPGNVGQEPPPTTVAPYTDCPAECSSRLNAAMQIISDLQNKITDLNITLLSRLSSGSIAVGSSGGDLPIRLTQVETFLYQNMTATTDKLSTGLASASSTLSQDISDARAYIDNRLATLPSGGESSGPTTPVFKNITDRLDQLEKVKVAGLITENNVWRRNFEVVNKTFSKMRKSSYSNEVIVVG